MHSLAEGGLPIFAECGGFMYLCDYIEYKEKKYPMVGALPFSAKLCSRPQGLGYTLGHVIAENPFFPVGTKVVGHEFHYSLSAKNIRIKADYALELERGKGIADGFDGMIIKNIYAGYNHIHALGVPCWAGNFVKAALKFKSRK